MLRTQLTVQPRFRNPAGEIVGAYRNSAGVHGFVLRDEVYVPIDFSGCDSNPRIWYQLARRHRGTYVATDGKTHGFLASQGRKGER
jgi:hypothetical protein